MEAIYAKDLLIGALGLYFASMAVFNFGCCTNGACFTTIRPNSKSMDDVSYEEIN
ncbi:hypothetical protein [Pedobacter psychrophilus]|uniref:hypothetical protein n=1 Tax=Pedobacter psychrophilus TaxID=1826909 RepID=UPI0018DFE75F|nr:hypothetical protein [Pedobacter psychrophilus]